MDTFPYWSCLGPREQPRYLWGRSSTITITTVEHLQVRETIHKYSRPPKCSIPDKVVCGRGEDKVTDLERADTSLAALSGLPSTIPKFVVSKFGMSMGC